MLSSVEEKTPGSTLLLRDSLGDEPSCKQIDDIFKLLRNNDYEFSRIQETLEFLLEKIEYWDQDNFNNFLFTIDRLGEKNENEKKFFGKQREIAYRRNPEFGSVVDNTMHILSGNEDV